MADWTEKYRPRTLSEVRGNDKARKQFKQWADTWDDHRQAAIIHGSPGVGKTSAAHALANDMGWPVMELNASDSRTADDIKRFAGRASQNQTLGGGSGGRQLLIVDEADNFHGNSDYGGSREVTRIVKEANQPIVLIANEFYDMSNSLRNACKDIQFRDVSKRSIVPVLRDLCRKEDIEYEQDALEKIAENTSGDLRSAVNDLQALAEQGQRLTVDDVVMGERDKTEGIFDFLDDVIKHKGAQEALYAAYDVDETPDDLLNWVEDNMPKDYRGDELADAYGYIARGDTWLGRVRSTQDYSFWRYVTDNVAAGVAASRQHDHGGWTRYGPPSYWSKLGRSKGTRKKRDAIARKIAEKGGFSIATARRDVMPFLATMTHHCKPRDLTVQMAAVYEFDAAEVSFITGSGESTNKVQDIVADAEELRETEAVEHSGGAFEGFASDSTRGGAAAESAADGGKSEESGSDDDQQTLGGGDSADTTEQAEESADEEAETDDGQSGLDDWM
ncbi:replication factor C large subunit [Haloarchaeobius sp. HME9146]|uniref:replication factor C large subunit n=1 Tax=Haloarchaeobius sp. HME9146 TaxID=2978732 RepID=UPI0021C02ACF|nr:replication factor C large subunit [Haloarchaeobius sp. HME9146]MCT9097514.1 replication factor C large subunit [Haloarchaeobius sp. HME9146]